MILIAAGRRIDDRHPEVEYFPERNVPLVKKGVEMFFAAHKITALISSAACGADLLVQEVAMELGIKRTIVLPFNEETFRKISVVDRGGTWGELYDSLLNNASVHVLGFSVEDHKAYNKVNDQIIAVGKALAGKMQQAGVALCLWNGVKKKSGDATDDFRIKAKTNGFAVKEINTLTGVCSF